MIPTQALQTRHRVEHGGSVARRKKRALELASGGSQEQIIICTDCVDRVLRHDLARLPSLVAPCYASAGWREQAHAMPRRP